MEDEAQIFAIFVSLHFDSGVASVDLPVVCDFQDVFLDDISDFPP